MIRINLIPHREEERQKQIIQHIVYGVGSVAVCLMLLSGINTFYEGKLSDLQEEYSELNSQNKNLAKKIGKIKNLDRLREDVTQKLKLVDSLQNGRFHSLEVLLALSEAIPDAVWLTSVQDMGDRMKTTGFGDSNKSVANFMRALDKSEYFSDIRLEVIQRGNSGSTPIRQFNLTMNIVDPAQDEIKNGKKA